MRRLALLGLASLVLASCQTTRTSPTQEMVDETALAKVNMKFVVEDIPTSFWKKYNDDGTLLFDFFLFDQGKYFSQETLKSISVTNEYGTHWGLEPNFYTDGMGGWFRCTDDVLSLDRSLLSLGKYTFDFEFKSGAKLRKKIDLRVLSGTAGAYKYLYSGDYAGRKGDEFLPALARPVVLKAGVKGDLLSIDFTVNDPRVKNFDVFLYDKEGRNVADTPRFLNTLTGQISKNLNSGTAWNVNGTANHLELKASELFFEKGKTLKDLSYLVVNVNDVQVMVHAGDFLELHAKSERFTFE